MTQKPTVLKAFWRGCSTALDVRPVHRVRPGRFVFRGCDLSKMSASDALSQDWRMVGASINSALQQMNEREDERPDTHEQCGPR